MLKFPENMNLLVEAFAMRVFSLGSRKKLWKFDKKRRIPLLRDVFEMFKDKDMILYLEVSSAGNSM